MPSHARGADAGGAAARCSSGCAAIPAVISPLKVCFFVWQIMVITLRSWGVTFLPLSHSSSQHQPAMLSLPNLLAHTSCANTGLSQVAPNAATPLQTVCATFDGSIRSRDGFFHAMLSYRVSPDQDFVTKVHHMINLLCSVGASNQMEETVSFDSSPWPSAFERHDTTKTSCARLFQDAFCLRAGQGWEGDGSSRGGGFIGALRLSVVFVPFFSAHAQGKGSIGGLLQLAISDKQDNVLLELIIARELHLVSKKSDASKLCPCSHILPLFMMEDVFQASSQLPQQPSLETNKKALEILRTMKVPSSDISPELLNQSLTPKQVYDFFAKFQGVKLFERGSEPFQIEAAAKAIIRVIKVAIADIKFYDLNMNCSQMNELNSFLSGINLSYYSSIMASHQITSIFSLSSLGETRCPDLLKLLATRGAQIAEQGSVATELVKLESAILASKSSPQARSLCNRFDSFIDQDASFVTAMTSACAVDIFLSKRTTLVVFGVGAVLSSFCFILNCFYNFFPFGYDDTFFPTYPAMIPIYYAWLGAVWLLFAVAMLVSHFQSPRYGRFMVAFCLFMWACLYLWVMALSVHSAIHTKCQYCAYVFPAYIAPNYSLTSNIWCQPFHGIGFLAGCVFMLFKQEYFMEGGIAVLILESWIPWIIVSTQASVWTPTSAIFWISVVVLMKVLQYIGRHRARAIFSKNSRILSKAKYDGQAKTGSLPNHIHDGLAQLENLGRLTNPQPRGCLRRFLFFLNSCCLQNASNSHHEMIMNELQTLRGMYFKDAHSRILGRILSDEDQAITSSLQFVLSFVDEHGPSGKSVILQPHSKFDVLISDAEFINHPFQDWAASWLSNGADFDSIRPYLFLPSDDESENSFKKLCSNEHRPIRGVHVRGPVKHVDRAIAKVTLCFWVMVHI